MGKFSEILNIIKTTKRGKTGAVLFLLGVIGLFTPSSLELFMSFVILILIAVILFMSVGKKHTSTNEAGGVKQTSLIETNKNDVSEKQILSNEKKLIRQRELLAAIEHCIKKFTNIPDSEFHIPEFSKEEIDALAPTVELHIHSMDVKDLQKELRDNNQKIDELTAQYESRYTTKANKTIYSLMVIALRAELQNILVALKYNKKQDGIDNIHKMTAKYLQLACDGNQQIASTMTRFVGELEHLFENAVKIEYKYYERKEQARQEQIAIREQMKQEAAEKKALEAAQKKVEAEQGKFLSQIEAEKEKLSAPDCPNKEAVLAQIAKLQEQLAKVEEEKEKIINLQNGKAGFVYIISNLGSFGENIFKVGMTRRTDPQDRVDELGNASVPFEFDVHSFIFSEDAPALETALHKRLDNKRVNKVNNRKEFFNVSLDELEALTFEICPTAEFTRTMVAEEYRQSLSA